MGRAHVVGGAVIAGIVAIGAGFGLKGLLDRREYDEWARLPPSERFITDYGSRLIQPPIDVRADEMDGLKGVRLVGSERGWASIEDAQRAVSELVRSSHDASQAMQPGVVLISANENGRVFAVETNRSFVSDDSGQWTGSTFRTIGSYDPVPPRAWEDAAHYLEWLSYGRTVSNISFELPGGRVEAFVDGRGDVGSSAPRTWWHDDGTVTLAQ